MGIIEIILTIFAWRNGWKWKSLIPMGIALGIGLLVGLSIGISGGDISRTGWVHIVDIGAIIALIVMIARKPEVNNSIDTTPKV